ncbi:MAG: phage DNA encapsidation protein [Bacilli bacterium]|nr:phage DNA encapsidation protein [Bacilli bacterium]
MATPRDNIHFTFRTVDGYNLPFNFVISEREPGKSTAMTLDKLYKCWKENGETSVLVRRRVVHITEAYINDLAEIINKFTDDAVTFEFSKGSLKDGIVDVKIAGKRFIRVVGLSVDITQLKSLVERNLRYMIFDEFICNPKFGEKYLKDEATKFMEVYNTFRREAKNLKVYFLGNPYSLYNPYFMFFGVDTSKLKRGAIVSDGKSYVIQCYEMTKELKEKIMRENPLYQFDNTYTRYAFEGQNINDQNIIIRTQIPEHYPLRYAFRVQGKVIAVYSADWMHVDMKTAEFAYYARFVEPLSISKRRDIICFDFDELVENTALLSPEDRNKFSKLKTAMRNRDIAFSTIECYYLLEEVYFNL